MTRSPSLRPWSAAAAPPRRATRPRISWPRIVGSGSSILPCRYLTSVPQTPAISTATSPPSGGMSGIGYSRISILSGATRVAARQRSAILNSFDLLERLGIVAERFVEEIIRLVAQLLARAREIVGNPLFRIGHRPLAFCQRDRRLRKMALQRGDDLIAGRHLSATDMEDVVCEFVVDAGEHRALLRVLAVKQFRRAIGPVDRRGLAFQRRAHHLLDRLLARRLEPGGRWAIERGETHRDEFEAEALGVGAADELRRGFGRGVNRQRVERNGLVDLLRPAFAERGVIDRAGARQDDAPHVFQPRRLQDVDRPHEV